MFNEKQQELVDRINRNFEILMQSRSGVLPIDVLDSYKRDITLLCSRNFAPEVLNLAMDIMFKIADARERRDCVSYALLQVHTYECFRVHPDSE